MMKGSIAEEIEAWEDEGGAAAAPPGVYAALMSGGTSGQVEWAGRIKRRVNAEFDRVAAAFQSIAGKEDVGKRADTEAVIAILEGKRAEVMSREEAGYFIHDWQEISDQVRQMIFHDARYQAIKGKRAARRTTMKRQFISCPDTRYRVEGPTANLDPSIPHTD